MLELIITFLGSEGGCYWSLESKRVRVLVGACGCMWVACLEEWITKACMCLQTML